MSTHVKKRKMIKRTLFVVLKSIEARGLIAPQRSGFRLGPDFSAIGCTKSALYKVFFGKGELPVLKYDGRSIRKVGSQFSWV